MLGALGAAEAEPEGAAALDRSLITDLDLNSALVLDPVLELIPDLELSRTELVPENKPTAEHEQHHEGGHKHKHPDFRAMPEVSLLGEYGGGLPLYPAPPDGNDFDEICNDVVQHLNLYGLCVLDNFLGPQRGLNVLQEVLEMYSSGMFEDGQLVSHNRMTDLKTIRSDRITWVEGREPKLHGIRQLIRKVDSVIVSACKLSENTCLGQYTITGRTKAMVACYPGYGSHYVKHVDNPNKDGRCLTVIYYLNLDWDVQSCGGLLRIYPEGWKDQVANIEPLFDRALFFWSDRRNPHEVQPAYSTRYAITLWYFDAIERREACMRYHQERLASSSLQPQ